MKKLVYLLIVSSLYLMSCTYYAVDPEDGESFLKLNWVEEEPSYVDPGSAVPNNFVWNTYYRTYPGIYNVYYEYEYYSNFGPVVYPYEIDIEIWDIPGGNHYDNEGSIDGDDVFFDLALYPDGMPDFTHIIDVKSASLEKTLENNVEEKTVIGQEQQVKNGKGIKYTIYKLPAIIK